MQNMVVGSFIENIKTKIFIKFHFINFMTYLARVANSMVIFSASYMLLGASHHSHNKKWSAVGHFTAWKTVYTTRKAGERVNCA